MYYLFLLILYNYNIENADDSFDIHKNVVLISMLITWSEKPDAYILLKVAQKNLQFYLSIFYFYWVRSDFI